MRQYMYCHECGEYFESEDVKKTREYHREIDGNFYELQYRCPYCGSQSIEDVDTCVACDEPEVDLECGGYFCPDCKKAYYSKVDKFIEDNTHGNITKDILLNLLISYVEDN